MSGLKSASSLPFGEQQASSMMRRCSSGGQSASVSGWRGRASVLAQLLDDADDEALRRFFDGILCAQVDDGTKRRMSFFAGLEVETCERVEIRVALKARAVVVSGEQVELPPSLPSHTINSHSMTSKKRRRPAADDPAQAISLHGYHLLPSELQHHIIHLACLPTPNDSRSLFPVDRTTLLRLCLVSRSFNRVATGKLYRNVVITQPSALYPLYQTLTARPSLAALVKSFHIGPTSALSPHWWPLTFAYPDGQGWDSVKNGHEGVPYHWMSSSLEAARLPLGCQDRQAWVYDRAATGCREAAVHEALSVAQRSLNVDLAVPQHGPLPPGSLWRPNIGQIWASRVFEAQAALDLYLEEVRAVEEADPKLLARQTRPGARVPAPCRNGKCGCYPALYITGVSTPPPSGAFKVSRAQLLHHIARRGALTDHFDHPLVFIRSSLGVIIHQPPGKGFRHYSPAFTCARYELYSDRWDSDSLHASHHCADFAFLREKDAYSWPGKVTDAGRFSTATFDSTLRLTQGLLGLLPCLENLSLTGYLEKTLDGWTAKEKSRLRRLSLGPTPETWKPQLHLDSLSGLEQLRICDVPLRAHDIVRINQMKRLRQLAWTMTGRYPPDMGTR